jgi:hypothetical protein
MKLGVKDPIIAILAFIDAAYAVHTDFKLHSGMISTFGYGVLYSPLVQNKNWFLNPQRKPS